MTEIDVPVLVVGGGIVGLSTALFLADQGVAALTIEKHSGTAIHPRARGFHASTIELFESTGLAEDIARTGLTFNPSADVGMLVAATLAGPVHAFHRFDPRRAGLDLSARTTVALGQDRLEPMVLDRARSLGADIRFEHTLLSFEDRGDHVLAHVLDRASNRRVTVRARFLVAADGARSPVRESLGIARTGIGSLGHAYSALFSADLSRFRSEHPFVMARVTQPGAEGLFIGTDVPDRWLYGTGSPPHEPPRELPTTEQWVERIRAAAGDPSLAVTVHGAFAWEPAERVAERLVAGRIALVGDAAHQMPPTGGYGANTGIHDAANLAWKLAAIVAGHAPDSLLATYDDERRPVAQATARQSLLAARQIGTVIPGLTETEADVVEEAAVVFGYRYGHPAPLPRRYEPSGDPGTRAPHAWVTVGGERVSTARLFGRPFVLLAGTDAWSTAAASLRPSVRVERVDGWQTAYGVEPDGAVLVRPDGVVASRLPSWSDHASDDLAAALAHALGWAP